MLQPIKNAMPYLTNFFFQYITLNIIMVTTCIFLLSELLKINDVDNAEQENIYSFNILPSGVILGAEIDIVCL